MKKNLSKVIRVMVAFCIVLSMPCQFCACSKKTETTTEQTTTLPNKQDMFHQIHEYEDQAKFTSAIELYRQMNEYNYIDADSLEIDEKYYVINSVMCQCADFAINRLKERLKDPHSLVVYGMKVKVADSKYGYGLLYEITLDYGATNSFGGMVRDDFECSMTVGGKEDDREAMEYIVENHEINKESQFEAIINGTAEYDKYADSDDLAKYSK